MGNRLSKSVFLLFTISFQLRTFHTIVKLPD
jgi:hypothetical protein